MDSKQIQIRHWSESDLDKLSISRELHEFFLANGLPNEPKITGFAFLDLDVYENGDIVFGKGGFGHGQEILVRKSDGVVYCFEPEKKYASDGSILFDDSSFQAVFINSGLMEFREYLMLDYEFRANKDTVLDAATARRELAEMIAIMRSRDTAVFLEPLPTGFKSSLWKIELEEYEKGVRELEEFGI